MTTVCDAISNSPLDDPVALVPDDLPASELDATASGLALRGGPAVERAMALVYDEMRRLARVYLRREHVGHTLEPTALVHEAYLRLVGDSGIAALDRVHFFAIAATVMRRVLVEHARARDADKRGGGLHRITLNGDVAALADAEFELLDLEDALNRLAEMDERQARVVELRFFGGLTVAEAADVLGLSKRSVESDWELARAWLHRELASAGTVA